VPDFELPTGQYLSLVNTIRPTAGGRTRALLMRNRLFTDRAGVEPTIITTDDHPDYHVVRESWTKQGYLVEPMRVLNPFEWYRGLTVEEPSEAPTLPDLGALPHKESTDLDGRPYLTVYRHAAGEIRDYRRPDGTVYLRTNLRRVQLDPTAGPATSGSHDVPGVTLVSPSGREVRHWPGRRAWLRGWIERELAPGDHRVFLFCDSRVALARVAPMTDPRFVILHVMHNAHIAPPGNWNFPIRRSYLTMTHLAPQVDGLVLLTPRQREDYGQRFGMTTNLFAVPNPVQSPPRLDPPPPRDPMRFAMVCRLHGQKRVDHAIRAFALVVRQEPDARLDIYGDGILQDEMQALIDRLGVTESVVLHGWNPHARDELWTASGFLMTSKVEGYPLATLESMSHGCPVVSYDIKYGPRDQITDGVDGFLVEAEDIQGMADRVLELIRDPALVAKMSEAGFVKALQHDSNAFLRDWLHVMQAAIAQKDLRTRIRSVRMRGLDRSPASRRRWRLPLVRSIGRLSGPTEGKVSFSGALEVIGSSPSNTLDTVVLSLDAIEPSTETVVALPLQVTRSGSVFRLECDADLDEVLRPYLGRKHAVRFRLRVVWANSCWQAVLDRAFRTELPFAPSDRSI
jgi:poly(glycerol-phosphate) alpha-glucosyltransferase